MRKKLISILLVALAAITVLSAVSCSSPNENESAYLTVDINPSIELLVVNGKITRS